jgi:hypothetical protein
LSVASAERQIVAHDKPPETQAAGTARPGIVPNQRIDGEPLRTFP